jgi:hypothetical protein
VHPDFPFLLRSTRGLGRGAAMLKRQYGSDGDHGEPGWQGGDAVAARFRRPTLNPRGCAAASLRLGLNGAWQTRGRAGALSGLYSRRTDGRRAAVDAPHAPALSSVVRRSAPSRPEASRSSWAVASRACVGLPHANRTSIISRPERRCAFAQGCSRDTCYVGALPPHPTRAPIERRALDEAAQR